MKESDWLEVKWSKRYQTCVSRLIPLVCEFDHCQRETNSLYELGCVRACRSCFLKKPHLFKTKRRHNSKSNLLYDRR